MKAHLSAQDVPNADAYTHVLPFAGAVIWHQHPVPAFSGAKPAAAISPLVPVFVLHNAEPATFVPSVNIADQLVAPTLLVADAGVMLLATTFGDNDIALALQPPLT